MKKRLTFVMVTLLLSIAAPTQGKNLEPALEDTLAIATTRNSIVSKGIRAYKNHNYSRAVCLLKTFLNTRRVIANPLEKEGLNYLALAYQQVGKQTLATETIDRAISLFDNSTLELANLENTAGIIADRQNKKIIANQHWEKARQLYSANHLWDNWAKITIKIAQNHLELGNIAIYKQLLQELENY